MSLPTARALVDRARASARFHSAPLRRRASELRSPRRTALRVEPELRGPAPSAYARFGERSWIVPPARVRNPHRIAIGDDVGIMEHSSITVLDERAGSPLLVIGDRTRLTRGVTIVCEVGVELGVDVASSDGATILDTWRLPLGREASHRLPPPAPVVIEDGAYLACNCTVCPGVRIGAGAFVGEGAVVLDDVPAHAVVYGNPAVVTRHHDERTGSWIGPEWP